MGKGLADSVTLDADRVTISIVEDIYDALDLGGNEYQSEGIRHRPNKVQKELFALKAMETGTSFLIPLCITNGFGCADCTPEPEWLAIRELYSLYSQYDQLPQQAGKADYSFVGKESGSTDFHGQIKVRYYYLTIDTNTNSEVSV